MYRVTHKLAVPASQCRTAKQTTMEFNTRDIAEKYALKIVKSGRMKEMWSAQHSERCWTGSARVNWFPATVHLLEFNPELER